MPDSTTGQTFTYTKVYDPAVGMPAETSTTPATREQVHAAILDHLAYANELCENEFPGHVTLNTDRTENPTCYYLAWHDTTTGTTQVDTFTLTPTNTEGVEGPEGPEGPERSAGEAYYVISQSGDHTFAGPFTTWEQANTVAEEIEATMPWPVTDITLRAL